MQSDPIIIKCQEYRLKPLLMLWFIVFLVLFFILWPFLLGRMICGSLAVITFLLAICTPLFSESYDIFSHEGIKRIKRGVVLFEISWDDVERVSYLGMRGVVILAPHVLWIRLKEDTKEKLPQNLNNILNETLMAVPLRKKDFEHIEKMFISPNIGRF